MACATRKTGAKRNVCLVIFSIKVLRTQLPKDTPYYELTEVHEEKEDEEEEEEEVYVPRCKSPGNI